MWACGAHVLAAVHQLVGHSNGTALPLRSLPWGWQHMLMRAIPVCSGHCRIPDTFLAFLPTLSTGCAHRERGEQGRAECKVSSSGVSHQE